MYFESQISRDYILAATEIITSRKGFVEFAPNLFMVSNSFYVEFAGRKNHPEIIDEITLYHKQFFIIRTKPFTDQ